MSDKPTCGGTGRVFVGKKEFRTGTLHQTKECPGCPDPNCPARAKKPACTPPQPTEGIFTLRLTTLHKLIEAIRFVSFDCMNAVRLLRKMELDEIKEIVDLEKTEDEPVSDFEVAADIEATVGLHSLNEKKAAPAEDGEALAQIYHEAAFADALNNTTISRFKELSGNTQAMILRGVEAVAADVRQQVEETVVKLPTFDEIEKRLSNLCLDVEQGEEVRSLMLATYKEGLRDQTEQERQPVTEGPFDFNNPIPKRFERIDTQAEQVAALTKAVSDLAVRVGRLEGLAGVFD